MLGSVMIVVGVVLANVDVSLSTAASPLIGGGQAVLLVALYRRFKTR
jgi:hypothetical protein